MLIKKRCKNLVDGMLFIKGQNYALPSILVKLFREGYDTKPLSSLVLESLSDCEMTNDALMRKNYLCINPYHYGYESPPPNTDPSQNHFCRKHMRLQSLGSAIQPICKVCRKVQTEENLTDGFFNVRKNAQGVLTTTAKSGSTTSSPAQPVRVKTEVVEELPKEPEVSIEELDRDFQGMLDSIEDQVKDELEETLDIHDEDLVDTKANLRLDIGPAANSSNKRPLEDSTNQTPAAKRIKAYVPEKRPPNANFQCWQCLNWYADKTQLKTHSCLNSLNITGGHIFTCHFCATCSDDLETLRPHVQQCKKFNLAPLKCFMKFESVITSTFGSAKDSSRSRRANKSDAQPSKCDACSTVFPSKSELVLHNSKPKCKSVKCDKCEKNFANDRTLEKHSCNDTDNDNAANDDNTRVDQDIKVIKLDRQKINHQVINFLIRYHC